MNNSVMVRYAVACLEGLDRPVSSGDLSRSTDVPLPECLQLVRQFKAVGLVQETAEGLFSRTCAMEELTALQVLQAIWTRDAQPQSSIQVLFGTFQFKAQDILRQVVQANVQARG